mmetsp:Transcript_26543/g.87019  ORF Transcript_26543/g.87019 Transcript_26543/m.87019 type:complete len:219 (+) Transcript_26543:21-677(+)
MPAAAFTYVPTVPASTHRARRCGRSRAGHGAVVAAASAPPSPSSSPPSATTAGAWNTLKLATDRSTRVPSAEVCKAAASVAEAHIQNHSVLDILGEWMMVWSSRGVFKYVPVDERLKLDPEGDATLSTRLGPVVPKFAGNWQWHEGSSTLGFSLTTGSLGGSFTFSLPANAISGARHLSFVGVEKGVALCRLVGADDGEEEAWMLLARPNYGGGARAR